MESRGHARVGETRQSRERRGTRRAGRRERVEYRRGIGKGDSRRCVEGGIVVEGSSRVGDSGSGHTGHSGGRERAAQRRTHAIHIGGQSVVRCGAAGECEDVVIGGGGRGAAASRGGSGRRSRQVEEEGAGGQSAGAQPPWRNLDAGALRLDGTRR
jgi:hypothetical protein